MSDVHGHEFPPYVWQEWPKFIRRSDGSHLIAESQDAVDAFLEGDAAGLAAYRREEALTAEQRMVEAKHEHMLAELREQIESERQKRHEAYAAAHDPETQDAAQEALAHPRNATTGRYSAQPDVKEESKPAKPAQDTKPAMKA